MGSNILGDSGKCQHCGLYFFEAMGQPLSTHEMNCRSNPDNQRS